MLSKILKPFIVFFLLPGLIILSESCRKGPGPGGRNTITGKVYLKDFRTDSTCMCYLLKAQYYAGGEYVYLNYGEEKGVGQYVRTADDGSYLFEYLLPGKYKIYAVSRDTTSFASNSMRYPVIKEIEISGKRENIVIEDIIILK